MSAETLPPSMKPQNASSYWAAADPENIGAELVERKERYYRFLRASGQLELWRTAVERYFVGADNLGKIRVDGSQDEQIRMNVNHVRNVAQILLNNITQQKITFQPKAVNTDSRSQTQTILAKGVLDYAFKDKRIDTLAREIVDMTLCLGEAGVFMKWDGSKGDPYGVDPSTEEVVHSGDIRLEVLNPLDIIRDFTRVTTRDHSWLMVRRWVNRWRLAAEFAKDDEDLRANIENAPGRDPNSPYSPLISWFGTWQFTPSDSDEVEYTEFYHLPTPELPMGRHVCFVNGATVLVDEPMELRKIPIFQMFGGVHFGRSFGYTSIFDALSIQAGVDALYSSIATNNTLATQNIAIPNGAGISIKRSRTGMNIIKYDPAVGKPEPLQMVHTSPETYNFLKILEHDIELISGVNSVARGQPESSLKSGNALALVQSQTIQFAQGLNASYVEMLDDVASTAIELYQKYASVPQTALIVGKSQRSFVKEFTGGDLDRIVRVQCDLGSPMANSLSGRVQMAQDLLQYKGITPEEYLMVVETGKLENMTEGPVAELLNIRSENELLSDGKPVQTLIFDNHPLHIKEHHALVSSPEARENAVMVQAALAHIQEHVQLWFQADPNVLQALGIPPAPVPPPPPPPPPPMPKPAIIGTAEAALTTIMNDPMVDPKDRITAASNLLKTPGANLDVPPQPPLPPPMPSGGPPKVGKLPKGKGSLPKVLGPTEGSPNDPHAGVRMPSMPKNPMSGERISGPVSEVAPPGVMPPLQG